MSISELIQHLVSARQLLGEVPVRYSLDGSTETTPIYTVADLGGEVLVLIGRTMAELQQMDTIAETIAEVQP